MKKLNFFILFVFILINCVTFQAYANEHFISVGLTKYKNLTNISLDNKSVGIGKFDNNTFHLDTTLNGNNFNIKPLNGYGIKHNNKFYSYDEALNFAKNYNKSYVYKDDSYYVITGSFNNNTEANNYMTSQNIVGEVVKLENTIGIYDSSNILAGYKDSIAIKTEEFVSISKRPYRNVINITIKSGNLNIVNILNVEEYLYGVVPSEMPPSWHKEALKAQSVAARNYAYANLGLHKNDGYDVCDTIHCQVYNGVSNEQQSTNDAINETKGVLAYYNNQLINAVYSSSSGGYTDDAENVWNSSIPYLKAVKDEFEEGGKQWTRTFTFDELSSIASIGSVNEVILENSSVTGRATKLTFVGTNGQKVLEKEEIRTFFSKTIGGSLDSRNFKMAQGNTYISQNNNTNNQNNSDNNKDKSLYAISSKNNNTINKDNTFVIDKNNNKSKLTNTYAIDKSQNTLNITNTAQQNNSNNSNENNNNNNNITYVSKITRQNSNSITFVGKGWGHGVGMSQYGANSLAKKGYKYDEILKYYYTGIEVR